MKYPKLDQKLQGDLCLFITRSTNHTVHVGERTEK